MIVSGQERAAKLINSTTMTVQLTEEDVAMETKLFVLVQNAPPSTLKSKAFEVAVVEAKKGAATA